MQLRTAVFITFVPALAMSSGVPDVISQSPSPFGTDTSNDVCEKMPLMPTTFVAKREFASFRNTIVFYDSFGKELGFVQSWLIDWRNPFGYPGASFYLKAAPAPADREKSAPTPADGDIWSMSPQRGEDGEWESAQLTHADLARQEEEMFKAEEQGEEDLQQNADRHIRGKASKSSNHTWSFWDTFFPGEVHHMVGSMSGSHVKLVGGDEMTIRDCEGLVLGKAGDGKIMVHSTAEARYDIERASTENSLMIRDLGTPSNNLVRVEMKEPSSLQMRMWNWFVQGNKWEGQLMQPRFGLHGLPTLGHGFMNPSVIQISEGFSTDMRFLTLYSSYQFSNTRWSPLMSIIAWVLLAGCCCGCIQCCCCRTWASKTVDYEETQSLVSKAPAEKPEKPSMFACCSRKGGRSISLSN